MVCINISAVRHILTCFLVCVGHRCEKKGCGTVLVLDGNQKNNRPVCAAGEAGFVEYAGLPGKVKTGCMATPEQSSLFCSLHKPHQLKVSSTNSEGQHGVIEMILRKKETRSTIHYEVKSTCRILVMGVVIKSGEGNTCTVNITPESIIRVEFGLKSAGKSWSTPSVRILDMLHSSRTSVPLHLF